MIVYVETNFLLEIAYRQERCASCDEESRDRLESTVFDIHEHGVLIPLAGEIIVNARAIEILYSLSPQDALVLASVLLHAGQNAGSKCFITQDVKGFANLRTIPELSQSSCKVLVNFDDAASYLKTSL